MPISTAGTVHDPNSRFVIGVIRPDETFDYADKHGLIDVPRKRGEDERAVQLRLPLLERRRMFARVHRHKLGKERNLRNWGAEKGMDIKMKDLESAEHIKTKGKKRAQGCAEEKEKR